MVFGEYRAVNQTISEVKSISGDSMKEYFKNHFDIDQVSVLLMGDVEEK
jgi:predicted Zn-dependent peptidase